MAAPAATVLSHIYTISTVFFTLLLLELIISFRTLFEFLFLRCSTSSFPNTLFQLIEDRAPSTLYKIRTLSSSESSATECCSVCLSGFEEGDKIRKLECKHTFHKDCLDRWLEQEFATTCPLCRLEVLPEEVVGKLRLSLLESNNNIIIISQYHRSDEELIFLLSALQGANLHTLLEP